MREYHVYILANNAQVLYIGMSGFLDRRLFQHLIDRHSKSFVARYNLDRMVYCENHPTARESIAREKQLKGWSRERKKALIRTLNPEWRDLFDPATKTELILRQAQDDGVVGYGV